MPGSESRKLIPKKIVLPCPCGEKAAQDPGIQAAETHQPCADCIMGGLEPWLA